MIEKGYIVHVFPHEQFAIDYMKKLNQYFDWNQHKFLFLSSIKELPEEFKDNANILYISKVNKFKRYFCFISILAKANKVILHSLPTNDKYLTSISIVSRIQHHMIWMIWGYDLYNEYWEAHSAEATYKVRRMERLRKSVIRRLKTIMYIEGDYEVAKKWYKTKADYMYASYSYDFEDSIEKSSKNEDDAVNILVGHSATNECRHIETFEQLTKYHFENIHVYCPMSYPMNSEYISKVKEYGEKSLPKLTILTDFMPYDEYMRFLKSIDIAIFNNNRQQGLGNIAGLLAMGKKVYISQENNLLYFFLNRGVKVFEFKEDESFDLTPLTQEEREKNSSIIRELFSDEMFVKNWSAVFEVKLDKDIWGER